MSANIYIFFRKPMSLKEIESGAFKDEGEMAEAEISETITLTTKDYDDFASNFMLARPWLDGKGGFRNRIRQVVKVAAPDREDLFIDPSGYNYARYVGVLGFDMEDDE